MNISRRKLIAQRRKADKYVQQLVQYKQSAVGLVFMESAVELAMETFSRKTLRCYFSRRSYSGSSRNAKISRRNVLSIQSQEDSGEAFDEQDASNSSIQSKSLYESAVANQPVASFASSRHEFPDARKEEVAKRSS
ncbi:Makorin-1 [Dorcoceras hygrometricum]|uniref:Makorin-1 n=1 Tax=Dorcoceras hygrometricum TaxID=472368 RepID=A0A2Z7C1V9_9LAMI|nr:Makorin-1 [Dorcoceras hygrometricum]